MKNKELQEKAQEYIEENNIQRNTYDIEKAYVDGAKMIRKQGQTLPIDSAVGSALMKDLLDGSEDVIAINGLRFTGTHEEKIKQIFDNYGIKYKIPF